MEESHETNKPLTNLVISINGNSNRADVVTDEPMWQSYLEDEMGFTAYEQSPDGSKRYQAPLHLLSPFGRKSWPDEGYAYGGSWYGC